jgi:hypothetical protein
MRSPQPLHNVPGPPPVNFATPVGGGNSPARSRSNVFAIRVGGMSRSLRGVAIVGDLSIDMYRSRSGELTEHPVGSECGRGKFCVHVL